MRVIAHGGRAELVPLIVRFGCGELRERGQAVAVLQVFVHVAMPRVRAGFGLHEHDRSVS